MEMKQIFGADPISTWKLLTSQGVGFYIPAYQREYSWDKTNMARIFEDLGHGLQMLIHYKDAVTFIGALIVIHDVKNQTVEPIVKGQLPNKVLLVIDGQQRLSTLLLINTILHEQLSITINKLKALTDDDSAIRWLSNKTEEVRQELKMTFEQDMIHGEGNFKWYPRIIRAYDDSWSREALHAHYNSPIAAYLYGYANYSRAVIKKREYLHKIPDQIDEQSKRKHQIILQNYRDIRNWVKGVASGSSDLEIPELQSIIDDVDFQETLLNEEFPEDVITKLTATNDTPENTLFTELVRLIVFSRYANRRVAVTLVTAQNEEYAFDMFEALNTTGTPLTAFETFKPRVINAERLTAYERSPSRKYIQPIESYLNQYKTAEEKQKATDRLLIPFALAESGRKLSKRLSEQRSYLKQRYEELVSIEEKRDFIRHLSHTAIFIRDIWPDNNKTLSLTSNLAFSDRELTDICLKALREANHQITIGSLARFYSQVQSAKGVERTKAIKELEDAIKAVTAFLVLWRGVRRGTGGIDSQYRNLMLKGNNVLNIEPLSRREITKNNSAPYKYCQDPIADDLKAMLRYNLANSKIKIQSKTDWIRYAKEIPFYTSMPKPVIRLLLLASIHDTYYDDQAPGLPKAAKQNSLKMLSLEQWQRNFTIEHIAPKDRNASGWSSDLYDDPNLVHQIGNLTLLPQIENSVAGNQSWEHKRLMYRVLAAPTEDELEIQMSNAQNNGLNINRGTKKLLEEAQYLPHVRAIGMLEEPWNKDFVRKRSDRLLELAWDRLAPWLGFDV